MAVTVNTDMSPIEDGAITHTIRTITRLTLNIEVHIFWATLVFLVIVISALCNSFHLSKATTEGIWDMFPKFLNKYQLTFNITVRAKMIIFGCRMYTETRFDLKIEIRLVNILISGTSILYQSLGYHLKTPFLQFNQRDE